MPNVIGFSADGASVAITGAGLAVGTVSWYLSAAPAGSVIGQSLSAGSARQVGSPVDIFMSQGGVLVPNLIGSSQSAATNSIAAQGLALGTVSTAVNSAPVGSVFSQSPVRSALVAPGTTVNITVSLGAVTVPNVIGSTKTGAINTLTGAGLGASVSSQKDCIDPGNVLSQSPSGGAVVAPGSYVYLHVDSGTFKSCGAIK